MAPRVWNNLDWKTVRTLVYGSDRQQNAFGVWANVAYLCACDPINNGEVILGGIDTLEIARGIGARLARPSLECAVGGMKKPRRR